MPVKVTPFTVVVGTPVPPMLNAPTSVPVVSTSVLPEIVFGEPQRMAAASARPTCHKSSVTAARSANPAFVAKRIYFLRYPYWVVRRRATGPSPAPLVSAWLRAIFVPTIKDQSFPGLGLEPIDRV